MYIQNRIWELMTLLNCYTAMAAKEDGRLVYGRS